jgi:RNase P subunit RPR2
MGYAEIIREDGTVEFYGDVPVLICQMCNEIPHQDESVRIRSISPIQWQCEKCHAVNG